MKLSLSKIISATALLAASSPSFAHTGHAMHASFSEGFLHPLTGIDHLAALVLIGFFAASYSYKKSVQIIASFAAALMAGFFVGVEWSNASMAESLVAGSLIALPVALYAYRKTGAIKWLSMISIAAFSACHGLVQGAEASEFGLGSLVASVMVMVGVNVMVKAIRNAVVHFTTVKQ
jgi:urease accessory protein